MLLAILSFFILATGEGPMGAALEAAEAPVTFRAAFTVSLESPAAAYTFNFDPRRPHAERWQALSRTGQDPELDQVAANWAAEPAPDGWLLPDGLRAALGTSVQVDTGGAAWKIGFRHTPSRNATEIERWAAQRLDAVAWLDPVGERFQRIDYRLPRPVSGPSGGRLLKYDQVYHLRTEPRWGLTYVSGFNIALEARAGFRTIERRYRMRVVDADFFFATPQAEQDYLAGRAVAAPTRAGFTPSGR